MEIKEFLRGIRAKIGNDGLREMSRTDEKGIESKEDILFEIEKRARESIGLGRDEIEPFYVSKRTKEEFEQLIDYLTEKLPKNYIVEIERADGLANIPYNTRGNLTVSIIS
jgi:hypothetical protein